ncbi:MAG TPA: cyclase family protein, partial [Bacteroidales bacterium]|nr:cyclase family protein [Bacteroidales bacterium]
MRNNSLRVIDLTHTIESTMSVFPGTSTPVITQESTIERDNYAEKSLSFCSHTGTHIDAPSHIFENSCSL